MGNLAVKACSAAKIHCKVRVLLPDGELVAIDGPVAVIDMMQKYPDHMVVHCSSEPREMGKRPSLKVMLPDQQLETGEAYLIYPVPPQYKTILLIAQSYLASNPQPPKTTYSDRVHSPNMKEDADKETKPCKLRTLRIVASFLPRSPCKSRQAAAAEETQNTSLLDSDHKADTRRDNESGAVKFSFYMGWKPALESIPESQHELLESPLNFSKRPIIETAA